MTKTQAPSGTRIVLIVFLVVHIATELFLLIFTRCIASNSGSLVDKSDVV